MQRDERLCLFSLADFIRRASGLPDKVKKVPSLILHIVSCDPVANVCFISICQKRRQNTLCLPWVGSVNPPLETALSFRVWLRPWSVAPEPGAWGLVSARGSRGAFNVTFWEISSWHRHRRKVGQCPYRNVCLEPAPCLPWVHIRVSWVCSCRPVCPHRAERTSQWVTLGEWLCRVSEWGRPPKVRLLHKPRDGVLVC